MRPFDGGELLGVERQPVADEQAPVFDPPRDLLHPSAATGRAGPLPLPWRRIRPLAR